MKLYAMNGTLRSTAVKSVYGKIMGEERATLVSKIVLTEMLAVPLDLEPQQYARDLRANVRRRIKASPKVGFPWITLAIFLAEILIKIILKRRGII